MHVTVSDGTRLRLNVDGQGAPIVLVHGWMMSGRFFQKQAEALSGRFRVVRYDLRGCGESRADPGTCVVPRFAQDLSEVLDALDLDRVVLVGWSMGGGIVMEYAQRFGWDRLAGVGLVDFPPRLEEDPSVADKVCHTLEKHQDSFARDFLRRMFLSPPAPEDLQWMVETALRCSPTAACQMYRSMRPAEPRQALGPFPTPALLVFPEQGWFRPSLEEWRRIFSKHSSPTFERSKHCPFLEEPERFNEELARFAQAAFR